MFVTNRKPFLLASACILAAGLSFVPAPQAQAQVGAYPAAEQVFSVTAAPGRWNQTYAYDLHSGAGSMSPLRNGSSADHAYTLHSSFDPEVTTPYTNYIGVFIYDYTLASWCEVFYVVDGSNYAYPS